MRTTSVLALAVFPCVLTAFAAGCAKRSATSTEGSTLAAPPASPAARGALADTKDERAEPAPEATPAGPAASAAAPPPPAGEPVAAATVAPPALHALAGTPARSAPVAASPAPPTDLADGLAAAGGAPAPAAKVAARARSVDAPAPREEAAWAPPAFSGVKAGEWDDNANYREFKQLLGATQVSYHPVDLRMRRFLVVRDAQGKPIPRCKVRVSDDRQHTVSFVTTASGRAILFPRGEGLTGARLTAEASCAEGTASSELALQGDDGLVDLHLQQERSAIPTRTVDLAFILDTTGSMSEEISAVTQTIRKVAEQLQTSETRVRIGMVEYKDRTDPFVTKVYPMTQDLQGFAAKVATIQASGGGDTPEDMNAGIHDALTKLDWSQDSVAKMAFVIADAPPHLDYQGPDYAQDMKVAAHRGIELFTVAASGMDLQGQIVMRQMAQYTGGTNMFVLRGGAGPQSTGGGDPASSCGGTHQSYASGNLHEIIVAKIRHELKSVDGDPMRIAGLNGDENAKPCDRRVVWLD